jgi:hypothetical protein
MYITNSWGCKIAIIRCVPDRCRSPGPGHGADLVRGAAVQSGGNALPKPERGGEGVCQTYLKIIMLTI